MPVFKDYRTVRCDNASRLQQNSGLCSRRRTFVRNLQDGFKACLNPIVNRRNGIVRRGNGNLFSRCARDDTPEVASRHRQEPRRQLGNRHVVNDAPQGIKEQRRLWASVQVFFNAGCRRKNPVRSCCPMVRQVTERFVNGSGFRLRYGHKLNRGDKAGCRVWCGLFFSRCSRLGAGSACFLFRRSGRRSRFAFA